MSDHEQRDSDNSEQTPPEQNPVSDEDLVCAVCGGPIEQDDLVCPNCGVSLVAG